MNKNEMTKFKKRLLKEKSDVEEIIKLMKKNETITSNTEASSELSTYDNHPSDTATELFNKEKGLALKENELNILKKIDSALKDIEEGSYGKCKGCGKKINKERLNFIPYAEYCVCCQNNINAPVNYKKEKTNFDAKNRAIEEKALGRFAGYVNNDFSLKNKVQFDSEDSYQSVARFNRLENVYDEYFDDEEDGYVEPVEKISNEQYKRSLE
ncbi:TraR/DksA C4-type zinc finger protein [Clostridium rectalis]|uniref:TraR/DksA C4-type zinc finger protein n=1 Tax=Clostridium rectalis TaxID=2040295 RepID=UPI000F62CBD9|nr:TraR/DksA C4-type zinc finger protein [Clostridium rectalis]